MFVRVGEQSRDPGVDEIVGTVQIEGLRVLWLGGLTDVRGHGVYVDSIARPRAWRMEEKRFLKHAAAAQRALKAVEHQRRLSYTAAPSRIPLARSSGRVTRARSSSCTVRRVASRRCKLGRSEISKTLKIFVSASNESLLRWKPCNNPRPVRPSASTSLVDGTRRATAARRVAHILRIFRTRTIPGHSAGDIGTVFFLPFLRHIAFLC